MITSLCERSNAASRTMLVPNKTMLKTNAMLCKSHLNSFFISYINKWGSKYNPLMLMLKRFQEKHASPHIAGATEKPTAAAAITNPPEATVNPANPTNAAKSPIEAPVHSKIFLMEPPFVVSILSMLNFFIARQFFLLPTLFRLFSIRLQTKVIKLNLHYQI